MNLIDLHTHTLASGHAYSTLSENAAAAKCHGLKILGVSDHAPQMPGAAHLFYFRNLHVIPETLQGVRILKGAELNILDCEGQVDLDEKTLEQLDYAIASLHVPCYSPQHSCQQNTAALIAAAHHPRVKILGHPDDSRFPIDQRAVAEACLQTRTLIEVNNSSLSPHSSRSGGWENMRSMLQHCAELKVPVLFGSDAHFCEQIGRFDLCRQLCAEVGFPGELIVNDQPERIQEFFGLMIR